MVRRRESRAQRAPPSLRSPTHGTVGGYYARIEELMLPITRIIVGLPIRWSLRNL